MKTYIVTVKYLVKEARDSQDAIHRASEYQCGGNYHEFVEELDCTAQELSGSTVFALVPVAEVTENARHVHTIVTEHGQATEEPGVRLIDGQRYYSAAWL